jgi:hypothetical protein
VTQNHLNCDAAFSVHVSFIAFRATVYTFFFKRYLLVKQFVHQNEKTECIQLFLAPIVKIIHGLLVSWATNLVLRGPLNIRCKQWKYTIHTKKHCCRWFQGTLKVEYASSVYGYTFCIAVEDHSECSFRWLVSGGWYDRICTLWIWHSVTKVIENVCYGFVVKKHSPVTYQRNIISTVVLHISSSMHILKHYFFSVIGQASFLNFKCDKKNKKIIRLTKLHD